MRSPTRTLLKCLHVAPIPVNDGDFLFNLVQTLLGHTRIRFAEQFVPYLPQQPLDVPNTRAFPRHPLITLFLECRHHELPLLGLNVEHHLLDTVFHNEAEDGRLALLAETMNPILFQCCQKTSPNK